MLAEKQKILGLICEDEKRVSFFGANADLLENLAEHDKRLKPFLKRRGNSIDVALPTLSLFALQAHKQGWIFTIE